LGQGNQSSLRTRMFTLQKGRIVRNRKLWECIHRTYWGKCQVTTFSLETTFHCLKEGIRGIYSCSRRTDSFRVIWWCFHSPYKLIARTGCKMLCQDLNFLPS
jgi:hypothetical protein